MRISASLGVFVASGLLGHSSAQAVDYGNPTGSSSGNPGDGYGSIPPGNPDGAPGSMPFPSSVPGTAPGSFPGGIDPNTPGNFPGGVSPDGPGGAPGTLPGTSPGNVPGAGSVVIPGSVPTNSPQNGGVSGLPTCPFPTTKTVVVTIYPTTPQGASGIPAPDGSGPDQTNAQPPLPTQSAQLSLTNANSEAPFTTLTLDLWGTSGGEWGSSPDPSSTSGTDANAGTDTGVDSGDDGATNNGAGSDNGVGSDDGTDSGVDNSSDDGMNSDNGIGSDDGIDSGVGGGSDNGPSSPFFSPVTGPGQAPSYSNDGPDGSSGGMPGGPDSNTQTSAPFQTPGPSVPGDVPGGVPQVPPAGPGQEASDSLPVTTQADPQGSAENYPSFTNVPGGGNAGQSPASAITITGKDGLPTVISVINGQVQPLTSVSPQDGSGKGLPSGISSGVPFPLPSITGGSDGSLPQGPSDNSGSPLPDEGSEAGITTCATFTITGTDGVPTLVDSTWVIPFNTPVAEASSQLPGSGTPQGTLSGIPIDVGSIPTSSVPVPGSPQDDAGPLVVTTCTSYTLIGTDGLPTVVHTTWAVPVGTPGSGTSAGTQGPLSTHNTLSGFPTVGPAGISTSFPTASDLDDVSPITTCTSFTIIGTDGLPTVVDSTWVIPGPANTGSAVTGGPGSPSEASDALPNGIPPSVTTQHSDGSGLPSNGLPGSGIPAGVDATTCSTYTMIGPDGLPTVVDSTWVIPGAVDTQSGAPGNPSFVSDSLPSGLPTGIPAQVTASSGLPSENGQGDANGITTCISYTLVGTDGLPTVVESTFVIPTGAEKSTETSLGLPSITGIPQPGPSDGSQGTFTTLTTAIIIGPDGQPTPTVQTIVFSDSSALGASGVPQETVSSVPAPSPSGPIFSTGDVTPISSGVPSLNDYGAGLPNESMSAIVTGSSADSASGSVSGTVTGTRTWTVTSVIGSTGGPVFSSGADEPMPSYDPVRDASAPIEVTLWPLSAPSTTLQTSTWTNVIVEETTSYTINFPLTTLATVTVPGKRLFRRQDVSTWTNSSTSATSFTENTSLGASLSSALSIPSPSLPSMSVTSSASATSDGQTSTSSDSSTPSICATGVSIGNTTIDFDNSNSGPLFNPVENIWFSGGFLIAPPTSQQPQPYIPSSGGHLVEFVPPALSNTTSAGSGDVAQIGVGPHAASPCFRFDFFGASLGCDAQGSEKWCEFEISAYRWNETSSREESIAWSETKQVPACPTFSEGGYELTPINLEGYTDLSSVLITLRVSQELRVWWGDDLRVGWSDNSCIAASCRTNVPSHRVKRKTVVSALRRGVYKWAPTGLERLDDALV
ncbi:hypothetical protein FZEAL_3609 [Fusarium zealandicum]|uniref:DUF7371 domain-containing protein n=1 Tax=Fusarium zealandicum TaxID=1053134 RepID=A0A8H4UND6_9HYPO|nr:hypothetical protein FZEAL_3609 [Fusarium zealandicum]